MIHIWNQNSVTVTCLIFMHKCVSHWQLPFNIIDSQIIVIELHRKNAFANDPEHVDCNTDDLTICKQYIFNQFVINSNEIMNMCMCCNQVTYLLYTYVQHTAVDYYCVMHVSWHFRLKNYHFYHLCPLFSQHVVIIFSCPEYVIRFWYFCRKNSEGTFTYFDIFLLNKPNKNIHSILIILHVMCKYMTNDTFQQQTTWYYVCWRRYVTKCSHIYQILQMLIQLNATQSILWQWWETRLALCVNILIQSWCLICWEWSHSTAPTVSNTGISKQ